MRDPFGFDPFDEATRRDPFPLYTRARREHPAWRHPGLPVVSVFGYDDVQAILKDPVRWSSSFPPAAGIEPREDLPPSLLGTDPPEHTRLRSLVNQAFTPRMVRRLEPRMLMIARELVDAAVAAREVDLVEALTYPLPVIVIADIIGIPSEDRAQFKEWSDALVRNLGAGIFAAPSPERVEAQRRVVDALRAYFTELIEKRRVEPREDLLSGLVQAELEGSRLSFNEMLQLLVLLLVAGNETTTTLIGNAVLELLASPDALDRLRQDPTAIPAAVEEVLRFASPVQLDPRRCTQPIELHGVPIEPNMLVLCWLGSANRDELVFAEPERFDIGRTENRHLAFGFGPHYCLGANLARLEARVALRVLLARTRSFRRLDDAPLPLHPSVVFRAVTRLPLLLEPAD